MNRNDESKYIFSYWKRENVAITEDINWEVDGDIPADEIIEKFLRFLTSTHSYKSVDTPEQLEFDF